MAAQAVPVASEWEERLVWVARARVEEDREEADPVARAEAVRVVEEEAG